MPQPARVSAKAACKPLPEKPRSESPIMRALCLALALLTIPGLACAENAFRWVTEPAFDDAGAPSQGVTPLKKGKLWGLMNADGAWLYEPQFEAVGTAAEGWFPVRKGGKWGVATMDGAPPALMEFEAIGTPAKFTPIRWNGQWWIFGPDGQFEADPLPVDEVIANDGTCILGKRGSTFVAISRANDPVLQQVDPSTLDLDGAEEVRAPSEGYFAYRIGANWFQADCSNLGNVIGEEGVAYSASRPMAEGKSAVQTAEGWGYALPYGGGVEIGGHYKAAREFAEGLAPVQDDGGKWGYVDETGKFVIPPQFDQAYSFADGLAGVEIGGKRGFLTPDGKIVADPQFDDFWRHDGGVVPVRQGELWGVIAPEATDPATRMNLPMAALTAAQKGREPGFTLQPSNPHYYVFQDIASVHSITVTPDETVMVTNVALGADAEIALWDFRTHRLIRKFPLPDVTQALLLPGTEIVAAGLSSGHLVLLDAITGAQLHRIRPHKNTVIDMVLSPDGKRLATTDGQTIAQWDLQSGQALPVIAEKAHKIRYSADGSLLYAGTRLGSLVKMTPEGEVLSRTAEIAPDDWNRDPEDMKQAITPMALTSAGVLVNLRTLSEQKSDGFFHQRLWLDVTDEKATRKIDLPEGLMDVLTLDVSPDGRLVAYSGAADDDYQPRTEVRDLATGDLVYAMTPPQNDVAEAAGQARYVSSADRMAFAPGGTLVMVGQEGQDILLLDPMGQKVVDAFASPLVTSQTEAADFDGTRYFSSDGTGKIWVWDLVQGRLETAFKTGEFSFGVEEQIEQEGSKVYLYSGLDDAVMQAFDMTTLQPIPLTPEEQASLYQKMDFDPSQPLPPEVQADIQRLDPIRRAVPLAGGKMGVISQSVGLHRAYDLKTGALLAEFLATPDGEWLVLTPEGFFAASAHGAELVSVSNGLRAFAVDQAYQALYRPDLVAAKLAGDPDGSVAAAAKELDLSRVLGSGPAPITRFSFPLDGFKAPDPEIEVEAELSDEGGGIGRVEWRVNGLTVEVQPTRAAAALDSEAPKAKARVALDPGQNVIEVVAYNAAGLLASAPRQVIVNWDGVASKEPPSLYVMAVGVNDYADGRLKLKYAANDARAFGEAMRKAGTGLFKSVEVVTLLDADVTGPKLDAAFEALAQKVQPQDVFLFFLAGHGKTVEGKYYFIPQDFRFEGEDPFRDHGIDQDRWQEWAARVRAKKSVLIYDTCESGSLTGTRSVDAAMAQSAAVERLTRAMGRTVLSASTDDAPALEGYRGHGVMTWAMLDAMGSADTNGNATIEVTELANYLDLKVPEISAAAFGMRQVPQMSIKGSDFALGAEVQVLGDAPESFPATLTHVVAGGTAVLEAPGGAVVQTIPGGVFFGVFKAEEKDGFARIAKDGAALGWVPLTALTPLQ